jgi:hypothetical protein
MAEGRAVSEDQGEILGPYDRIAPEALEGLGLPKKIDLVIYENGKRKVIGEATVDTNGQYLDITGVVTDRNYQVYIRDNSAISLHVSPHDEESSIARRYRPHEAVVIPPQSFQARGELPLEEG